MASNNRKNNNNNNAAARRTPSPPHGPGGLGLGLGKRRLQTITTFTTLTLLGLLAATASFPQVDAAPAPASAPTTVRIVHPLPRAAAAPVDAPFAGGAFGSDAPERRKNDKRQQQLAAPRQGVAAAAAAPAADDDTPAAAAAPVAPAAASAVAPASASAAPSRATANTPLTVVPIAATPVASGATAVRAAATDSKSPSSASSSSSASPTSTSSHTGFTLTDTDNKLYPLWIITLIAGIFAGLFVILCAVRWCIFRPHRKQDPDAYLTSAATGRHRSMRAGAKSLRKALTKRKLAGSSFVRRNEEGSVLLEVGDEVFAVPPAVAEEYQAAKKMFGGSQSGSSDGHGGASTPGVDARGNPFSWNGKAYLAQCLTRYEADKKRGSNKNANNARSAGANMNIDAWTRSASTLVTDDLDEKQSRTQAYGAKRFDGGDDSFDGDDDRRPKRGLSGRLAAGFRAAMRGRGEDDDEDLGDPEKTTDLSSFVNVSDASTRNGWSITPRLDNNNSNSNRPSVGPGAERASRRISSSTFRAVAAPTPVTKDTPRMGVATPHRKSVPARPSPAILQKSAAQQTRLQPRAVGADARADASQPQASPATRRFPHDPVLLNGPANPPPRTNTMKKVRVNSTAEPIGTPSWDRGGEQRAVSMGSGGSFAPGQMIAHGTVPQQQSSAGGAAGGPVGGGLGPAPPRSGPAAPHRSSTQRVQLPPQSQGAGQGADRQRSHRANTVRVASRSGAGQEVRLARGE